MKFAIVLLVGHLWASPGWAVAQLPERSLLLAQCRAEFRVKNLGFWVDGHFEVFSASIRFDPVQLTQSSIHALARVASIRTGIALRDQHLLEPDYLDAQRHPTVSFRSLRIEPGPAQSSYQVHGQLTIRGITREIQIPLRVRSENGTTVFETRFSFNRADFGMTAGSTIADRIEVTAILTTVP